MFGVALVIVTYVLVNVALLRVLPIPALAQSTLPAADAAQAVTGPSGSRAIVVLSHPDTYWITGNVIGVDGGEDIVG